MVTTGIFTSPLGKNEIGNYGNNSPCLLGCEGEGSKDKVEWSSYITTSEALVLFEDINWPVAGYETVKDHSAFD